MSMLSVEEQITRYGEWIDGQLPRPPVSPLRPHQPRRRQPLIAVVAVGAVLVVVIGVAAWVMNRGSEQSLDTVAPTPTALPQTPSVTAAQAISTQSSAPITTAPPVDGSTLGRRDGYVQVF